MHTHGRPQIERPSKVNCSRPEGRDEVTTKQNKNQTPSDARDLYGRCLDFRQAYKQLVRDPRHSWASILVACPMIPRPTTSKRSLCPLGL